MSSSRSLASSPRPWPSGLHLSTYLPAFLFAHPSVHSSIRVFLLRCTHALTVRGGMFVCMNAYVYVASLCGNVLLNPYPAVRSLQALSHVHHTLIRSHQPCFAWLRGCFHVDVCQLQFRRALVEGVALGVGLLVSLEAALVLTRNSVGFFAVVWKLGVRMHCSRPARKTKVIV